MKKSKLILSISIILLVILGIIVIKLQNNNTNTQEPITDSTVSRDKAIEILNQGEIEEVFQSHSLDVILKHKNGAEISTKEPNIDDIFDEVRKCGNICKDIILATE
ncbi:MAG: hypothetical protein PHR61_03285 [Candidatus Absconditabacteria bacterium]|nr:hypothetical protein [Candidatus Absconditabacteria bacterium]